MIEHWVEVLLAWLALPQFGLSTVFVVSFVSATLIPLGSEPVVFGMVKLRPDLFWPTMLVATVGNTLGGLVNYWIGYGAHQAWLKARSHEHQGEEASQTTIHETKPKAPQRIFVWLERFGPAACVLAWLPVVGDPLCSVAGWLKLSFWPCAAWMALGKFLRYVTLTAGMIWVF